MIILGNNTAGLNGKLESLKRIIEICQPVKLRKTGTVKLKQFIVFEKNRGSSAGGGLMTIVHENMEPVEIPNEHSEFLEVDINGSFGSIRTINCYGPQENLPIEIRTEFFLELETRIISAKENQKLICLQFDANSKLGRNIIPGDPHDISSNGKILLEVLKRQDLIVVNSTKKCSGLITRTRNTSRSQEESVIDFFVVCREMFEKVLKMTIDEDTKYVLTKFYKYKTKTSIVESDHNLMTLELVFKWNQKIKIDRKEIYNLRNIECQEEFTKNTSNNEKLIDVINNENIITGGAKWIKELKHNVAKSFKKIRVSKTKEKPSRELHELFVEREYLKRNIKNIKNRINEEEYSQSNKKLEKKLKDIENKIADIEAEKNFEVIKEHVNHLIDDTDNLNCIKMWELKKKLGANNKTTTPAAKKNTDGKLVTTSVQLKELYKNTYIKRMEHRKMKPELQNMYKIKMDLYQLRIEVCKKTKSSDWSEKDLLKVLKSLKKKKSPDSDGLIYEL